RATSFVLEIGASLVQYRHNNHNTRVEAGKMRQMLGEKALCAFARPEALGAEAGSRKISAEIYA
ncbi:MAG: hypothetical protein AAB734_02855, partial [Patescibacteria group bacterium]